MLFIIFASLFALVLSDVATRDDLRPLHDISNSSATVKSDRPSYLDSLPGFDHPKPQLSWNGDPAASASDEIWKRFVCKGTKMVTQMSWSDCDVGQALPTPQSTAKSPYEVKDLAVWGYSMYDVTPVYRDFAEGPGHFWAIAPWLRILGVSDKCVQEGGKWHSHVILHSDPAKENQGEPKYLQIYVDPYGVTRRVTGAYFYMAITPEGGIMTMNRKGPWDTLQELNPWDYAAAELPELQKSSDMMWIMYKWFVPPEQLRNLGFFVTLAINNPTTLSMIRRALDSRGKELTQRGERFEMTTDMGKALLGSPNGAGFAHLLIQRKAALGLKYIDAVWVFECNSGSKSPCMMFTTLTRDEAVPRTPDPPANPSPVPAPDQDPNSDTHGDPGVPIAPLGERSAVKKRNIVRVHTFRFDGNATVSSHYV